MPAAEPLILTSEERKGLERVARSSSQPYRAVLQARGLLLAGEGVSNNEIGRRVGVSANALREWYRRFPAGGVAGVGVIAPGRGRKPWLPPEGIVLKVVQITQQETPADGSTHWTTRSLAKRLGIGKDTVALIWKDHELKPWKVETSKISNDPDFGDKLVDVVGV
jgi:transposase